MNKHKNISFYIVALIGLILLVLSFLVMFEWNIGCLAFAEIKANTVAMVYNTALCFAFSAIGLLGFCAKQRWLSISAAVIIFIITAVTIFEFIFNIPTGITSLFDFSISDSQNIIQGRMAPNTAISFMIVAIAYLALAIKKEVTFVGLFIAGLASFFITNLALFFFAGYIINLAPLYSWSPLTPMALSTSIGLIILGVGLMFLVWLCGINFRAKLAKIVPAGVFLSAVIANLLLFHAFYVQERADSLKVIQANQQNIISSTISILQDHIDALKRMSARWTVLDGMNELVWRTDAKGLVKGHPGYVAIELINPEDKIQWVEPQEKYKNKEGTSLTVPLEIKNMVKNKQVMIVSKTHRDANEKDDFIIQVPLYTSTHFNGYIFGIVNANQLLNDLINFSNKNYIINILQDNNLVYSNINMQTFVKKYGASKVVTIDGLSWKVEVYPTTKILQQENQYKLAYIVLVLGLTAITLLFICYILLVKITRKSQSLADTQLKLIHAESIAKLGSWIWYPKEQKVWCSAETLNMLGLDTKNNMLDSNVFFEYIHPDQQETFKNGLDDLVNQRITTFSETYNLKVNDKEYIVRFEVSNENTTNPGEISGILQNITKIRQLEQQLYQAQKMEVIGQLTGGLAHDFNNMLMVIQGNLELLTMSLEGKTTELKRIESAIKAVERGSELTRRLLAFARRQLLQPKLVDLKILVSDMVKLIKPMLGESIEFSVIMPENLWPIWADAGQLENSIMNLVVNARDAIASHGKISFEVSNVVLDNSISTGRYDIAPGDYIKFSISDNGIGISKDNLTKVFEPFFTTKQTGKGSGLGLSMVYGFVKQSKGHVTIYSEIGHGTTINLYLPRAVNKEPSPQESSKPNHVVRSGNEIILVVEDETDLLRLTKEFLSDLGYHVLSAANGVEALKVIETETNIQLVCTDVVMPQGITGPDLAKKLREIYPAIKVLFVSGYTQNALSQNYTIPEETKILTKPYKMYELAAAIRDLLDK
jgi:signal transduction histidine kinase/sensor domain CHASE-containing protein/ActR/RegA family two-component response regulator